MTIPESSSHRLRRRPPLPLLVAAVFGVGVFLVPLVGLLSRTPWTRLGGLLEGAMAREAMKLSLLTSLETEFRVEVPDYEVQDARTFADLASAIARRL